MPPQAGSLAFLSLGSNLGRPRSQLIRAVQLLETAQVHILKVSSYYRTEPVDYPHQDWFLNQALAVRTQLRPNHLLAHCHAVERALNRERLVPKGPRTIDVDILLYEGQVVSDRHLVIPHPRLHLRRFVLTPLAEIAEDFIHPVKKRTVGSLLKQCPDSAEVVLAP